MTNLSTGMWQKWTDGRLQLFKIFNYFFKPKPIEVNYTSDRVKHFLGFAEVKFEDIPFYMCLNNKKCYELLI